MEKKILRTSVKVSSFTPIGNEQFFLSARARCYRLPKQACFVVVAKAKAQKEETTTNNFIEPYVQYVRLSANVMIGWLAKKKRMHKQQQLVSRKHVNLHKIRQHIFSRV
jgi:ureidoglycolate hydrolase